MLFLLLLQACSSGTGYIYPFRNPKLGVEQRAEDLYARLTPSERQQITQGGGVARLDVPLLNPVKFPDARAIAATWDPELAVRQAQLVARKALASGNRQVDLPPMGLLGGDTWLASRMTVAMVSGIQGEGAIAALPELEGDYADVDERTRNESIFPPFRAAVEEAGAWAFKTGSDEPGKWGFKGFSLRADEDLRRRLRAMIAVGMFDPSGGTPAQAPLVPITDESIVLLKNTGGLLPLSPLLGSMAVIGARLPQMPPQAVYASGNSVSEAVELARKSVAAVVFSSNPELITAVAECNRNTVAILDGMNLSITKKLNNVPAALIAWGSNDIGHVLFGEVNPSGKLPFAATPFPFGYGGSYTAFSYDDLQVAPKSARYGQLIQVTLNVRNTGSRTGAEVVQLYVHEAKPALERRYQELKAFRRVELKAGESRIVSFELDRRALSFYDPAVHDWAITPGRFEILAGTSAADIRARDSFELFR